MRSNFYLVYTGVVKNKSLSKPEPRWILSEKRRAAWKGLNASHSLCVMLLPAVHIPITINHMNIIQQSLWLTLLSILVGATYMFLAKRYWFKIPLTGIMISTLCFISAAITGHF
jgi:hypothetical protein